jgi:hypothetical protein
MKTQRTILAAIVALFLLGTAVVWAEGTGPTAAYAVEPGIASGGRYQLASLALPGTVATGGGYRLLGPATPVISGSGCCCTYLPCIVRN